MLNVIFVDFYSSSFFAICTISVA